MDRYFIDEKDGRYFLHDRRLGYETAIGKFKDPDIAQRICALLNADEASKETARKAGIRKRLMNRTSIGMPNEH